MPYGFALVSHGPDWAAGDTPPHADSAVDDGNAHEAGAAGRLGECVMSVSLLPFPFAPGTVGGHRSGHWPIAR